MALHNVVLYINIGDKYLCLNLLCIDMLYEYYLQIIDGTENPQNNKIIGNKSAFRKLLFFFLKMLNNLLFWGYFCVCYVT